MQSKKITNYILWYTLHKSAARLLNSAWAGGRIPILLIRSDPLKNISIYGIFKVIKLTAPFLKVVFNKALKVLRDGFVVGG